MAKGGRSVCDGTDGNGGRVLEQCAANELYYVCFYWIQALFRTNEMKAHTPSGVKSLFSATFIKEGTLDQEWDKLLAKLFGYRQREIIAITT